MKSKSKVLRGGIVALALVLAAGCGGSGEPKAKQAAEPLTGTGPITLATGKDTSGNLQNQIDTWNKEHPDQKVTLTELPESADDQRQQMVQNAQTKSDAYTLLNLDVVWTAEFAANRWVAELPADQFDLSKMLKPAVETSQYRGKLYAAPWKTDAGLLYFRKDLLEKAGVAGPPKTWAEMWSACDKVLELPEAKGASCYAGQFEKYEGLTCNFSEAVASAGGEVVAASGKPNVNTPQAKAGLDHLVAAFKDGRISKAGITYQEEQGRRAFESGKIIFHRQWPYQWGLANDKKGSSKVVGKFDVAPLPGASGPGVPTLGGHNLAISAFAKNKATALEVMKFLTSEESERANLLNSSEAPTIAALYDDPELVKKFPYLPTLKASVAAANQRPQAVRYGEVTKAIQEEAYAAISGEKPSAQALADLQNKLTELTKP
jgi:multiple sugar transport system substrate-binding protein